ncbi:MAG: UDP-N-acetylmuramoyl-L-alanyl-D-glutamate--2,6-diaminopimelate ligase, partial [Chlamydiae bacterium]|nr:UDP-N-acetylmuramoyl-L-alanyl-D-glutamate--2,6-diaminopimelate ligase [Chlamydiota bacterium]
FIPQAINAGAAAILTEIFDPFLKVPQIIHENPRMIEAKLSARYYRNPSHELFVAGVTGTKGKTTTTYLLRHLLQGLNRKTGLSGTIEMLIGEKRFPSFRATQDVVTNHRILREMVLAKEDAAVMEVSSHGLDQGRVDEIKFDLAIFTNLLIDHLDYHKTMEAYAAAKKKLFEKAKFSIFNADNPWTPFMKEGKSGLTFGFSEGANVRGKDLSFNANGARFTLEYEGRNHSFSTSLIGKYNVMNVLGVSAAGVHLGASLEQIASIFSTLPKVPGRLERVENDLGIQIFVDFSHMGAALENVLSSLREIATKKILVVFGCGGERGMERKKELALAAEKGADLSIITSDNPRSEDPVAICEEIFQHFKDKTKAILEVDRRKAIYKALEIAEKDDIVLIAGKGHEVTQTIGTRILPFDDRVVAKDALQMRNNSVILSS